MHAHVHVTCTEHKQADASTCLLQYTAITRSRFSPWEHGLRITGVGNVQELSDLGRVHPKAIVYMHRHGRPVREELLVAAQQWIVAHNARCAYAQFFSLYEDEGHRLAVPRLSA